eukprot:15431852-Alexandrium_andersonii.AAC.1
MAPEALFGVSGGPVAPSGEGAQETARYTRNCWNPLEPAGIAEHHPLRTLWFDQCRLSQPRGHGNYSQE